MHRLHVASVVAILAVHAALLAYLGWCQSPTGDEVAHLPAGLSYWYFWRFDLYSVNPPLIKMIAAIPVLFADPTYDWHSFDVRKGARPEWDVGEDFVQANPDTFLWYFRIARWACIPMSLIGGYFCYRWATELHTERAGLAALSLWCFSPNILAHGALITSDLGATAMGLVAHYWYWRWLKSSRWDVAIFAGIFTGIALLTKSTWLILFVMWPTLWLVTIWRYPITVVSNYARVGLWQLGLILALGISVLNLGYGFEGSFRVLGDYRFSSQALAGKDALKFVGDNGGNRLAIGSLADIPVPFPMHYVIGIDLQKRDFERGSWAYLRGQHKHRGWWYYYLYAFLVKVPLGIWTIVGIAVVDSISSHERTRERHAQLILLSTVAVLLTLASSQTGWNTSLRYALPILPLVFVWCSAVFRSGVNGCVSTNALATIGLCWAVMSSMWVYPYSLSYFNELACGPRGGRYHLIDANIDWGQDILWLRKWLDQHPEAAPLQMEVCAGIDPKYFGIESTRIATVSTGERDHTGPREYVMRQHPGWYVISVNYLEDAEGTYSFLEELEPVAMIGYSIYIYHISDERE